VKAIKKSVSLGNLKMYCGYIDSEKRKPKGKMLASNADFAALIIPRVKPYTT